MTDWNTYDYSYLRPPQIVFEKEHTKDYIQSGTGKKGVRRIFYNVKFEAAELEKLQELKELVRAESISIPSWWNDSEYMKIIYASKWNLKESIKLLKEHLQWLADPTWHTLNKEAAAFLEQGIIYPLGRDRDMRPIIHLSFYKIDFHKLNPDPLLRALCFALDVIKKHCLVPGYVENWILMIETDGAGIFNFPFKVLGKFIALTQDNYMSTVEKIYIMNPSFGLNTSWSVVSSMIDKKTAKKIGFIRKKEYHKLQEYIPKNMLEKKYGGDLPDVKSSFWPPPNVYNTKPYLWPWETAPGVSPFSLDGPLSSGANPPKDWKSSIVPQESIHKNPYQIPKLDPPPEDGQGTSFDEKKNLPQLSVSTSTRNQGEIKSALTGNIRNGQSTAILKEDQTTSNMDSKDQKKEEPCIKLDLASKEARSSRKNSIEEDLNTYEDILFTIEDQPISIIPELQKSQINLEKATKSFEVSSYRRHNSDEPTVDHVENAEESEELEGIRSIKQENRAERERFIKQRELIQEREIKFEGAVPNMRFCGMCYGVKNRNKDEVKKANCNIF